MSFLSEAITVARRSLAASGKAPKDAVERLKQCVRGKLATLADERNLRICDKTEGGMLRGPKRSRLKRENKGAGNLHLLCQEEYLHQSKLEVPYFRAVFNTNNHVLNIRRAASEQAVRLLGYEAPLMRKCRKVTKTGVSGREVACDLVGLEPGNRLLCIEGKVSARPDATDIVYGILESFAYGVCLQFVLEDGARRRQLREEVKVCLNEFHPGEPVSAGADLSAAYSPAAPAEYFREYVHPCRLSTEKARKRLDEAERLLNSLKTLRAPAWAGFLLLNAPCNEGEFATPRSHKTVDGVRCFEPFFKTDPLIASVADDPAALRAIL